MEFDKWENFIKALKESNDLLNENLQPGARVWPWGLRTTGSYVKKLDDNTYKVKLTRLYWTERNVPDWSQTPDKLDKALYKLATNYRCLIDIHRIIYGMMGDPARCKYIIKISKR